MQKSDRFSEWDLAIVNALEHRPRLEFSEVARVLGLSTATVSRRWENLVERGEAWVTATTGAHYLESGWTALISVECEPSAEAELAVALCSEPSFATVTLVTGRHQFQIDCFLPTRDAAMTLLRDSFAKLRGIRSRAISPISRVYRQGSQWRAGSLDSVARAQLAAQAASEHTPYVPSAVDAAIVAHLVDDGRRPWQAIAADMEISAQTAKRRAQRLLDNGIIALRCDSATLSHEGRQEVSVHWSIPSPLVDRVGERVASESNCRLSVRKIGISNFTATLWVRNFAEVQEHENLVYSMATGSTVIDRETVLHTHKRGGQIFDESGRRIGSLPLPLLGH